MMGGFLLLRYLQKERSDLLNFRAGGNKWQSFTAGFEIGWKISVSPEFAKRDWTSSP
jgi:hypothetical protein